MFTDPFFYKNLKDGLILCPCCESSLYSNDRQDAYICYCNAALFRKTLDFSITVGFFYRELHYNVRYDSATNVGELSLLNKYDEVVLKLEFNTNPLLLKRADIVARSEKLKSIL